MSPDSGLLGLLLILVGIEVLLVVTWLVERLVPPPAHDCPPGCRCRGRRPY